MIKTPWLLIAVNSEGLQSEHTLMDWSYTSVTAALACELVHNVVICVTGKFPDISKKADTDFSRNISST